VSRKAEEVEACELPRCKTIRMPASRVMVYSPPCRRRSAARCVHAALQVPHETAAAPPACPTYARTTTPRADCSRYTRPEAIAPDTIMPRHNACRRRQHASARLSHFCKDSDLHFTMLFDAITARHPPPQQRYPDHPPAVPADTDPMVSIGGRLQRALSEVLLMANAAQATSTTRRYRKRRDAATATCVRRLPASSTIETVREIMVITCYRIRTPE